MPEIPLASVRTLAVSSASRAGCLPAGRTWAALRSGATCIRCTRSAAAKPPHPQRCKARCTRACQDAAGITDAVLTASLCAATFPTWDRGRPSGGLGGWGWLYAGHYAPKAAARGKGVGAVDGGRRVRKGGACRRGVGQRQGQRLVAQHLQEQDGLLGNVSRQSHAL